MQRSRIVNRRLVAHVTDQFGGFEQGVLRRTPARMVSCLDEAGQRFGQHVVRRAQGLRKADRLGRQADRAIDRLQDTVRHLDLSGRRERPRAWQTGQAQVRCTHGMRPAPGTLVRRPRAVDPGVVHSQDRVACQPLGVVQADHHDAVVLVDPTGAALRAFDHLGITADTDVVPGAQMGIEVGPLEHQRHETPSCESVAAEGADARGPGGLAVRRQPDHRAAGRPGRLSRHQEAHLVGDAEGKGDVVGVVAGHVLPARQLQAHVSAHVGASVGGLPMDTDPRVLLPQRLADPGAAVRAGVVDEDQFQRPPGLREDGAGRQLQGGGGIVHRHDHADERALLHRLALGIDHQRRETVPVRAGRDGEPGARGREVTVDVPQPQHRLGAEVPRQQEIQGLHGIAAGRAECVAQGGLAAPGLLLQGIEDGVAAECRIARKEGRCE